MANDTNLRWNDAEMVDDRAFQKVFGEPLRDTLDLNTWDSAADLGAVYQRINQEVEEAIRTEDDLVRAVRKKVIPRIRTAAGAPEQAGLFGATSDQLGAVHRQILFNGGVEVCDGTAAEHDTLPVTITQLGVALVSYRGDQQSFAHRLFRRDLRARSENLLDDALALVENRSHRSGLEQEERESLSRLSKRGLMTYAERAALADHSTAPWRMGHGNPVPLELLTGYGSMELLQASLGALRRLILNHQKIVFVPSAPAERGLLTIGQALRPLEYCIVCTQEDYLSRMVEHGHYSQRDHRIVKQFCSEVGSRLLLGIYRASAITPPHLFYCHADHCHEAALIALADSVLQEHRGFPMLIDLADAICRIHFGAEAFSAAVQEAYAAAGAPLRFLAERQTRK